MPDFIAADMRLSEALGATMIAVLEAKTSADEARAFAAAITQATLPGTPERKTQDAAWARLTNRLVSAQEESL